MARAVGRIESDELEIAALQELDNASKVRYFKALKMQVAKLSDEEIKEAQKGSHKKALSKKELFAAPKDDKPADDKPADDEKKA